MANDKLVEALPDVPDAPLNDRLVSVIHACILQQRTGEHLARKILINLAAALCEDPAVTDLLAKVLTRFDSGDEERWEHAKPEGEAMRDALADWMEAKAP